MRGNPNYNGSEMKARASSAHKLMGNGNLITDKQLQELNKLHDRKIKAAHEAKVVAHNQAPLIQDIERLEARIEVLEPAEKKQLRQLKVDLKKIKPKVLPLTQNMEDTLQDLIKKRDTPFEFGEVAKSMIIEKWIKEKYGYEQVMNTKQTLKGKMTEGDCIELLDEVHPVGDFRIQSTEKMEDDFFTGLDDVTLSDAVEDIKSCWDLMTYAKKKGPDMLYYGQGQVYMHLTGKKKFRLCYCLVNTPSVLVEQEERRLFYQFGADEDNELFQEEREKLWSNHNFDHIPADQRVKIYEFDYDPKYIETLKTRVVLARKFAMNYQLSDGVVKFTPDQ